MHITRRNGTYYFRKKIPTDLVAIYGKREIIYSLRTRERATAARLALRAAVQLDDEFSLKRGAPILEHSAVPLPRPTASVSADGPGTSPATTKRSGTQLSTLIPIWRRDRQPTAKTVDAVTRAVREANDPDIRIITRQSIVAVRDGWIETGNSIATTNKKLGFIRLLLGIAKGRGMIESNHAEGAELPPPKRAVELRKPYSPEQAEEVMAATAGMCESDPAMYWLPRLAKWTGARLNELHQLRRCDLIERDGVQGIRITDEGEHAPGIPMTLKNAGSRRWVPLHRELSHFWSWAQALPEGPLLPVKTDKYGNVSAAFSKRYGKLIRNVCKIKDKDVAFHSWRHLFADKCRAAGVSQEVRMALMGHAEGGAAGTYGTSDGLPPSLLSEAVNRLSRVGAVGIKG
ncbi:Integrase [Cupriavidus sp. YR651]|uniref:site-specific integrase n=1 Tax=Cupriavidus sp. YR651 TaxID=1855315 RepID=UPI000885DBCB|nr:site-specific integrase [Cupriavidus sp. YR651]SDD22391.1 Integrase [Cupriavidus sp. YR651]